jgi:trigger factor
MQVSVETTGSLERRMEVQVPATRIEQAIEARLQSMSRSVRLKGFRPGKVPVKVVRQQFGQQVRNEVLGDVMQQSFGEAVTQQKLVPAGGPRIEPIQFEQGQDLKYRAVFEIVPQFELKGLDSLAVTKPTAEVAEGDIDAMLENLRKQQPVFADVERAAQETDRVTIDFVGTLDGVAFEGGRGESVPVVVGSGRMLPDFENGLKGVKAGEQKSIDVKFPADYQAANLAGKTAQFALTIKKVEEQKLPDLDEEFCKRFGVTEGGIGQLRNEVTENMRHELAQTVRRRLRQQLFDTLMAANPIEIPNVMIGEEIQRMQVDMARRSGIRDAAQLPPAEQFQANAKQRVALGLILGEVIKTAKLSVDNSRVQAKLEEMAQEYFDPEQLQRAYRDNQQLRSQLESSVLEDQVVDWLLERAKVSEQALSFKEIMNFGA